MILREVKQREGRRRKPDDETVLHCVRREGSTATTREGYEVYRSPGPPSPPATACGEPDSEPAFRQLLISDPLSQI